MLILPCLVAILPSTCFVKYVRNTHRMHTDFGWLSVFENPIDICLEIIV